MQNEKDKIIDLLDRQGPFTGKELHEKSGMDIFDIWKICNQCEKIITRTVGRRYLRLDREVEGYARLSPSIIREFFGYTVVGTEKCKQKMRKKEELLSRNIREISRSKFELAEEIMANVCESQKDPLMVKGGLCCIMAGDVVYDMAHLEPRPESSTGKLVNGSDLDIVVVTQDLSDDILSNLDQSIYSQKSFLLRNPSYQEEIDYVVKDISKVKEQLKFDSFDSMVASKILHEGKFLYGNVDIFKKVKKMLLDEGIPEKMEALEKAASLNRIHAKAYLLQQNGPLSDDANLQNFTSKDEKEEFF